MPTDSNGNFKLQPGYLAVTGQTIQPNQHNPPLEDLANGLTQRMMRSGVTPMTGPFRAVDGNSDIPGVAFNSAQTTGFYKTAAGIGIAVAGNKVAEFTAAGASRVLGELVPFTGITAPSGFVIPVGQTLSRATYADLWTFAQTQIAGGSSFYNNGNGSTTFGIGDLRGRVPIGTDAAAAVVAGYTAVGASGGSATVALTAAQLAPHAHAGTTGNMSANATHAHDQTYRGNAVSVQSGGSFGAVWDGTAPLATSSTSIQHQHSFTTDNGTGLTGAAHPNMQPSLAVNYILFAGA